MTQLQDRGSLIHYLDAEGRDACLGFLFDGGERGIFDPTLGRVEVTPEEAQTHNRLLSEALITGLDSCEVGQCGMFYYSDGQLKTWTGEVVEGQLSKTIAKLTLRRKGRVYEAKRQKDVESVILVRVE